MPNINPKHGISTLVNHTGEGQHPHHAHVMPLFQTSTFGFPDVATGAAIFDGQQPGYLYSRVTNPNVDHLGRKIAVLEGLDLLRQNPEAAQEEVVRGQVFGSGMAAITSAVLARVKPGDTILAQTALYGCTHHFFSEYAPRFGAKVVSVDGASPEAWRAAFEAHPEAVLAYAETPANPTMEIVDLEAVAALAHAHDAWLMVDNTFATPYCQRPLTLGADVVVHSTTKYLSGHGLVIGGAVVSPHITYMKEDLYYILDVFGGAASPFDSWITDIGLKTFELRMQRHCENAMAVAEFLQNDRRVARVNYPGLESHPGHALAQRQMLAFGGMLSFELKGGLEAGAATMNRVKTLTLAVSLGNVDSLVEHPASMTHVIVPPEERQKMGISDGLVRLSVGIENVEDIIADLDQAMR